MTYTAEQLRERLSEERAELGAKLARLQSFISSEGFAVLTPEERHRLRQQLSYMNGYHEVLGQRIAALKE